MTAGPGGSAKGPLGLCWWEECDAAGTEVVQGVPVTPVGGLADVAAAAARITQLGLIVCEGHAPLARNLAANQ